MMVDAGVQREISMDTEYAENKLPAKLLTVGEVARYLGVHTGSVRRWEKKGLLRSYTIGLGNNLRFAQEEILNFLTRCQRGGEARGKDSRQRKSHG